MEAKFEEVGEAMMVVHLRGRIDLETIETFVNCLDHLRNYEVIFNMRDLSFVGSNGITTFVDSMRDLAKRTTKAVKFCHVSSEFRRIFSATLAQDIEIHEDIYRAQLAFRPPQIQVEQHQAPGGFRSYFNSGASAPSNQQAAPPSSVTGEAFVYPQAPPPPPAEEVSTPSASHQGEQRTYSEGGPDGSSGGTSAHSGAESSPAFMENPD
ncbi:MAG: STAS domain-containing protein [Bdellovibrionaceae bacterium]|nr:STAS domain-containing protein [Bdellovibrionales bacterium]MCB9083677.1 STAS domain-containing protein [Pseudobdellovibrionaceae bacterium]